MAEVFLSAEAKRDLSRVPTRYAAAVSAAIDGLGGQPLFGKLLRGELKGLRSKRVGVYRIVYELDAREGRVVVHWIRHRSQAYR